MLTDTSIEIMKSSMTTKVYIHWSFHFAKYKSGGHALLKMAGAASGVVEAAENLDMWMPSNKTHEFHEPLDKVVFRSFEYY